MLTTDDLFMLTSSHSTLPLAVDDHHPLFFKDVRVFLKLTQEQMAKKLGVTATTINNYETGRTQPSLLSRHLMEKRLKISPAMIYRMFPPRPPKRTTTAGAAA